jgi:hypothetical protein
MGGLAPDAGLWVSGSRFVVVIWAVILDVFCNGAVQKAVFAGGGNGVKYSGMLEKEIFSKSVTGILRR